MNISKKNLEKLVGSVKDFCDETDRLYEVSKYSLSLFDNDKLIHITSAITDYLDDILPGSGEASYWCWELDFGRSDSAATSVEVDGVKFDLTTFDKWWSYLCFNEKYLNDKGRS